MTNTADSQRDARRKGPRANDFWEKGRSTHVSLPTTLQTVTLQLSFPSTNTAPLSSVLCCPFDGRPAHTVPLYSGRQKAPSRPRYPYPANFEPYFVTHEILRRRYLGFPVLSSIRTVSVLSLLLASSEAAHSTNGLLGRKAYTARHDPPSPHPAYLAGRPHLPQREIFAEVKMSIK
jgi:hypothetical protein